MNEWLTGPWSIATILLVYFIFMAVVVIKATGKVIKARKEETSDGD